MALSALNFLAAGSPLHPPKTPLVRQAHTPEQMSVLERLERRARMATEIAIPHEFAGKSGAALAAISTLLRSLHEEHGKEWAYASPPSCIVHGEDPRAGRRPPPAPPAVVERWAGVRTDNSAALPVVASRAALPERGATLNS